MLLATTIMLLVFRAPSATVSIMWITNAKMFVNDKPPFLLRKFHTLANLCATLNAATTFVTFIIYGTKFRSEFTRIYCSFKRCNKNQEESPTLKNHQAEHHEMKLLFKNDNEKKKTRQASMTNSGRDKRLSASKNLLSNDKYLDVVEQNEINGTTSMTPPITLLTPMNSAKSDRKLENSNLNGKYESNGSFDEYHCQDEYEQDQNQKRYGPSRTVKTSTSINESDCSSSRKLINFQ